MLGRDPWIGPCQLSSVYQSYLFLTGQGLIDKTLSGILSMSVVSLQYRSGKTATVMKEMRRYKLSILGLSKVRWTGFGEVKTTTGETIIYSGRDEGHTTVVSPWQ